MAFTFAAFTYITALIVDAFLLFFSIFHVSIFLKIIIKQLQVDGILGSAS